MTFEQPADHTRELRVLLDATGLGTLTPDRDLYVVELARAAGARGAALSVVCRPRDAKLFKSFNLDVHRAPDWVRSERRGRTWVQWGLPRLARELGVDVIHSPHERFPLVSSTRRVVSVHGTPSSPVAPRVASRSERWNGLAASSRVDVVVPSNEIAHVFMADTAARPNRVHVAHRAVDKSLFRIPDLAALDMFADTMGLTDWIVIRGEHRSAHSTIALLEAFRRATEFEASRPAVVITNPSERIVYTVAEKLVDAGFDIRIVDDLDEGELFTLLGGAMLVVQLDDSAQTATGVLEAMACGTTVLALRTPAHLEIGGDAVAYADDSAASMEIALTPLLNDPESRQSLATRAVTRSHEFSWDLTLAAHLDAWARARARS